MFNIKVIFVHQREIHHLQCETTPNGLRAEQRETEQKIFAQSISLCAPLCVCDTSEPYQISIKATL